MDVIMPSLGFDMTEGKVSRWLRKEGDPVEKGQPVVEIETEKAAVEVEALGSGILERILVHPGQTVAVGTVIGVIGEGVSAALAQTAMPPATTAPRQPTVTPEAMPPEAREAHAQSDKATPPPASPNGGETRIKATPIARKIAASAGLDLSSLKGTGPNGRIMERDVQKAIEDKGFATAAPAAVAPPPAAALVSKPAAALAPAEVPPAGPLVELSRMRQAIARRMAESKATVPHFYVTMEINMGEAIKMREQLNALASDADKISVNDLIVAAAARTLTRFPDLNASYRGDKIEMHEQVHVGIAVALEDGLLTPVLRDAARKSLKTIARESKGLSERARANKMRPDDFGPGTFTVSNLGMFGVDEFSAIINPPEAAILAVGAVTRKPVVAGDAVIVASLLKVTLSVDHRVGDGAQAARFLQELKKLLENPVNLLIEG